MRRGREGAMFVLTFPAAEFGLRNISKSCGMNLLFFPVGSRSEFVSKCGNRYPQVLAFLAVGDLLSLLLYLMSCNLSVGFNSDFRDS